MAGAPASSLSFSEGLNWVWSAVFLQTRHVRLLLAALLDKIRAVSLLLSFFQSLSAPPVTDVTVLVAAPQVLSVSLKGAGREYTGHVSTKKKIKS